MTPAQIAARNLAAYEAQWQEHGIQPGTITPVILTRYASQHDLNTLRPEDGKDATLEQHNAILDAFAALLKQKHNVTPKFITLDAASYLRWLAQENKTNTPENRAAFTALQQTQPHPPRQ